MTFLGQSFTSREVDGMLRMLTKKQHTANICGHLIIEVDDEMTGILLLGLVIRGGLSR